MNTTIALQYLAALFTLPSAVQTKSNILAIAVAANLSATSFVAGEPSERWIEIMARAMDAWGSVPSQAVAGAFLDLATDPGDVGPLGPDLSADQTPRPGFLSALGIGWFGTPRGDQRYATSTLTITNTSANAQSFAPYAVTFESTDVKPGGGSATYRNTSAVSNLAVGASTTVNVIADTIGSYGSASATSISILVTTTYGTMTVSGSTTATGLEREDRIAYIARCRTYADSLAPGGPTNAYRRAMNTAIDGTVLQRYDGSGAVRLTQSYVSPSSATSTVTMYVWGPSADQVDLDSCNSNVEGLPLDGIVSPVGCIPDCVALLPYVYGSSAAFPAGTPGAALATATTIAVTYSIKIKSSQVPGGAAVGTYTSGGGPPAPVAAVFSTILAALTAFLLPSGGIPIGGLEQTAGAGMVYTADLPPIIRGAMAGLYDPGVTVPGGATTAIAAGYYASIGAVSGTLVVVSG